jgi:hypothetical protein
MAKYRCRAQAHGPHQVEFKIRYPLPEGRRARYQFDLYVFLPAQLRVCRDAYASRRFVDDVVSYIRHTSPRVSLAKLGDPGWAGSPLARAEESLARAEGGEAPERERLVRELRTFGNAFRAAVRDERARVVLQAAELGARDPGDRVRGMLELVAAIGERARSLPAAAVRAGVDRRLQAAAAWTDEWASLNAEAELVRVWDALVANEAPQELQDAVRERIRAETAHRRQAGYPSVVRVGDPAANERAMHHESLLKKWAQGALYMSSEQLATSRRIAHVAGGIAAAAAMSFAVAATLLAQALFVSNSVPWALMIVVAYIFKDRIKEILRGSLGRLFPLLFFDRSGRLIDPDAEGAVGYTRETVRFADAGACPRDVIAARDAASHPFVEILAPDDVIHYNRIVKLDPVRVQRAAVDARTVTEILRIKTEPWLREMDDPTSRMRTVRGATVASVTVKRAYHVHLIAVLSSQTEGRSLHHYLVTVSRDGIQGVDEAATATAPMPAPIAEPAAEVSRSGSTEAASMRR